MGLVSIVAIECNRVINQSNHIYNFANLAIWIYKWVVSDYRKAQFWIINYKALVAG